jgi:PAS domain S-box-containing protein
MLGIGNSISKRLSAINLIAGGVALLLSAAIFFAYDLNASKQALLNDLSIQAQIVGFNCVSPLIFNDAKSAEMTLSALRASPHIVYSAVYTPSGQYFAGYWREPSTPNPQLPLPMIGELPNRLFRDSQFGAVQPIVSSGRPVGYAYIRSDTGALTQQLHRYLIVLGVILLAWLATAILVSSLSRRLIAAPISNLAHTAREVSRERNYALRANLERSPDEVTVLVKAFNEMLGEIEKRTAALQESEQQFRTLADSVPQLAWMAESDGYITWYNRRWYEYTGKTPQEMLGWGWQSVQAPEKLEGVLRGWRESLATGRPFEMVLPLRGRDGEYREFLTLAIPVVDARGKIARWFGTNTDITTQRRSEEALRQSEKLAATGRLAASIAHEINNPLEAVTNLIYLAQRNPNAASNYLSMADQELERVAEITRHTLGFFRDTSTRVAVDITQLIQEVLRLYERKLRFKTIHVKTHLPGHLEVKGFPGELRQAFANLVVNAIEAMESNGVLSIKASCVRDWSDSQRQGIRVTVLDTGSGIDRERLGKIFEPFYTTKKDVGTGLGLWLTQSLIQKHHGSIHVRSRTGSVRPGTAFSVFLPFE